MVDQIFVMENYFKLDKIVHTVLLQPLRWCCVDCMIHQERDVREEQKYMYVTRTSNNRMISSGDLYCCLRLLPQCEALRICRSGFLIATVPCGYSLFKIIRNLNCFEWFQAVSIAMWQRWNT